MDKKTLFIITSAIIIGIILFGLYYKTEHMVDVSTCPCNISNKDKKQIGDCKCTNKSDWTKDEHKCPADRTYGIIPPLLVEPRMILTDNSMRCGELDKPKDMPVGYMDDEMSQYDDNLVHIKRLYGEDDGEKFYADNSYSMSTMHTGLPPLAKRNMDSCLASKVIKRCGNKIMK